MKIAHQFNRIWHRKVNTFENCYLFFAVLRVVLVFIQPGYVHPDEFFQSMEIMTGDHFQLEHTRSWEFNNSMPLRSITLPFILLRVPWSFLEFLALYLRTYTSIELLRSYTYLVFPRLIYCLLSFVNDWSLFRLCRLYGMRHEVRLQALGSSWVMLVFGIHTFSNSIEMALCSVLLYLVAECMIKTNTVVYKQEFLEEKYDTAGSISEKVKIWKLKNALPTHNYSKVLLLASICVAGVFNRPTFLVFGAPIIFFYMLRGMGTKTVTFTEFNLRVLFFCGSAVPALLFFTFCDSLYYKYLTAGELQTLNIGIENFVFTPWNFIKYNLDANKTAEHGLHPKYVHLLVNIPLLYNVLGAVSLVSFGRLMLRFFKAEYIDLPRTQSLISLMSAAIFVPLFFLSLINHQEARFLIPVTVPIIMLHAPTLVSGFCQTYPFKEEHYLLRTVYNKVLCAKVSATGVLKLWYIANIALTVFFGFVHQAGIVPLTQHLEHTMQTKPPSEHFHLITSHVYSMPLSLVNVPSSKTLHFDRTNRQHYRRHKEFYLYEYGGLALPQLLDKIRLIISHCEMKLNTKKQTYRVYLALPTSLSANLQQLTKHSKVIQVQLRHTFYPHLSTEALPFAGLLRYMSFAVLPSPPQTTAGIIPPNGEAFSSAAVLRLLFHCGQEFGLALYEIVQSADAPLAAANMRSRS